MGFVRIFHHTDFICGYRTNMDQRNGKLLFLLKYCSRLQIIQVPDSDIGSHFGMLLENQEGSDVVFYIANEKFHAHKFLRRGCT
ncbi:hypothetical protein MKW98_003823 [Papaver atlanticum]|uniref:Uncharacterized protein n=1 Tax=Papaver atlanticum TaxID=357466 RepID=A0AAD4S3T5_9MAGN|nr:hypothetical protein MKW98_003823 [Papaver atlanticum]